MSTMLKNLWRYRLILITTLALFFSVGTTIVMANTKSVLIQAQVVNVRQGPGLAYNVQQKVKQGQRLTITGEQNGWYQVRLSGSSLGWIASWLVTDTEVAAAPYQQTTVTQGPVNLYSTSDTSSKVLGQLPVGQRITVVYALGDWLQIQYHQTVAWVQKKLTSYKGQSANSVYVSGQKQTPTKLSEATIVLDPGHGGSDTGALSTNNHDEKTYTLIFAKLLAEKLEAAGARVILTRSNDTFVSLAQRPLIASRFNADAFISLHFDSSSTENSATGFTAYYYNQDKDETLARDLDHSLGNALNLTNRGVQFGNFEVLRDNTRPSILLELGYINNQQDYASIKSSRYQNQATQAIVTGLTTYFKQQ